MSTQSRSMEITKKKKNPSNYAADYRSSKSVNSSNENDFSDPP